MAKNSEHLPSFGEHQVLQVLLKLAKSLPDLFVFQDHSIIATWGRTVTLSR